jgi:hypothetical protein
LAQQHRRPILRLGTAGAGLNVDKAVIWIHRIIEHPAKFHALDQFLDAVRVFLDRNQGIFITFFARPRKQIVRIAQIGIDFGEGKDNRFQRFLFFAQILRAFLVVPDGRIF